MAQKRPPTQFNRTLPSRLLHHDQRPNLKHTCWLQTSSSTDYNRLFVEVRLADQPLPAPPKNAEKLLSFFFASRHPPLSVPFLW